MAFIALFLPALITMAIRRKRNTGCHKDWISTLSEYGRTVLFCNLALMIVITYFFKMQGVQVSAFNSFPFFIKYVIMAIIYSMVIPYVEEIAARLFHIEFRILGREEEG
ncbi:MAG: hypothetical protein NC419_04910 [Muribaculaceae bacterium]|nr:hypothetical protein [Muribaculaceae bacterium]